MAYRYLQAFFPPNETEVLIHHDIVIDFQERGDGADPITKHRTNLKRIFEELQRWETTYIPPFVIDLSSEYIYIVYMCHGLSSP